MNKKWADEKSLEWKHIIVIRIEYLSTNKWGWKRERERKKLHFDNKFLRWMFDIKVLKNCVCVCVCKLLGKWCLWVNGRGLIIMIRVLLKHDSGKRERKRKAIATLYPKKRTRQQRASMSIKGAKGLSFSFFFKKNKKQKTKPFVQRI